MKPEKMRQTKEIAQKESAPSQLVVKAGGASIAGRKEPNQDAFAVNMSDKTLGPQGLDLKYKGVVAAIADGVSSSDVSQKASETSVTQFIDDYMATPRTWSVKASGGQVLKSLNHWLFHHEKQGLGAHCSSAMVASFSALVLKSNTAYLFHVGDCRIYLYRNQKLTLLTQDHRRYIRTLSAIPQHCLTRALGIDSHLEIDYQSIALHAGDCFLMCSDGIHDFLSETDIIQCISKKSRISQNMQSKEKDLTSQANALVQAAFNKGCDDNITCLFLAIESLPPTCFDESFRARADQRIPPALFEGQSIDQYKITRVLHNTSRSHLYLAQSQLDAKQYVLKMPSQNFSQDSVHLWGFVREGWIGEHVRHKQVVNMLPYNATSAFLYHVCDHVKGMTLRQWMQENPTPSLFQVSIIAKGALKAMRALQRMDVVHRDIKPDNLMVDENLQVTLIDLGSAQAAGLEEIADSLKEDHPVGDLHYAAPEYLKENKATLASDVFSLGVTLYELLTGHLPFKSVNALDSKVRNTQGYIPASTYRPDISESMDRALKKACHQAPLSRYGVLSEFEQDMKSIETPLPQTSRYFPLMEKHPLTFWKGLSALLFSLVLGQFFLLIF